MKAVTGAEATRENILRQISQAECIHFATHVSWKLSAIVLSPGEFVESTAKHFAHNAQPEMECDEVGSEMSRSVSATFFFLVKFTIVQNFPVTFQLTSLMIFQIFSQALSITIIIQELKNY